MCVLPAVPFAAFGGIFATTRRVQLATCFVHVKRHFRAETETVSFSKRRLFHFFETENVSFRVLFAPWKLTVLIGSVCKGMNCFQIVPVISAGEDDGEFNIRYLGRSECYGEI